MKSSKDNGGKSDSHKLFKDKAKNRVDDLKSVIKNLQYALQEIRFGDMLREWKYELDEPSPASSSLLGSVSLGGTFSTMELCRLLEHYINSNLFHDDSYFMNQVPQEHGYELYDQGVGQHGESPSEFDRNLNIDFDGTKQCGEDAGQSSSQAGPNMHFTTFGISGPKCALWDCTRHAQGSEWYQDYCSSSHA
ncbi:hypothetical protein MKX03_025267, partial [Papaver bracteatum]